MRKSYEELRLQEENGVPSGDDAAFTCDTCGENYRKPLLATVRSGEQLQRYYVCPRCMVKVGDVKAERSAEKSRERREKATLTKDVDRLGTEPGGSGGCGHFVGYLAKRGKDMPIPEECLTCSKMIDCMIR